LLTYSEQFDNAAWTKLQSSVTANSATAPDGTTTADSFIEDSSTNTHLALQIPSGVPTNTTFSVSVYAKPNGRNWIRLLENNGSGIAAYFDIQNGAVGTVLGGTTAITSVGNGWYRCSIRGTTGAAQTSINFNIRLANADGGESYTGNGTSGVFIWGAQVELGTPTEYQPITDFNTEFKAAFPTHSLYVDSNGVAPSVYPGDQVGLILDTSRGGLDSLGSELVTNGTFTSNTTGWTATNSTLASVNGELEVTATSSSGMYAGQTVTTTSGKFYLLTASLRAPSANTGVNSARVYIYETDSLSSTILIGASQAVASEDSTLTITKIFRATASTAFIQLGVGSSLAWGSSGDKAYFDNISVREILGNHAYQTTSGSRPALARTPDGGRRNLLTCSEKFDDAAWTKLFSSVTANNEAAPDGTTTADLMVEDSTTNGRYLQQSFTTTVQSYTFSCYFKQPTLNARRYVLLYHNESVKGWVFDIQNGVVGAGGTSGVTAPAAYTITSVGNGWYRCAITITGTAASNQFRAYIVTHDGTGGLASYAGNGSGSMLVWGAQVETGSTATAYQKVGLTSDVTESGKRDCWGLLFDGSDDSLQTAEISFNTWTQATRRNLLVDTESFGTSSWTKTSSTVTENSEANPIESLSTADSIIEVSATSAHNVQQAATFTTSAVHTYSVYAKANGRNLQFVIPTAVVTSGYANFDLINGVVGDKSAGVTQQITSLGNGWYRCAIEFTAATGGSQTINLALITASNSARGQSYLGDGTSGIYLWGAQLEAGTLTDYQRVGTDKMTVMAGVRKNSDAADGMVCELTTTVNSNTGSFYFTAPELPSFSYALLSRGTATASATQRASFATAAGLAPNTSVISSTHDIAGDLTTIRRNGVAGTSATDDKGSGSFSSAILYIGSRAGSSVRFNGIIYTLIIRGATTPTGTIADFEKNLLRLRAGMGAF
jgi:hypothetical protein